MLKGRSKNSSESQQSFAQGGSKRAKGAPSILSANLRIKGTLDSDGDMQLDGHMEGTIRSASLTIGEKAVIDGDIVANDVMIRGRVNGNIRARLVKISGTAHIKGDILQKTLAVEPGAIIDGNCRHVEDPLSAKMPKSSSLVRSESENSADDSISLKLLRNS